MVRMSIHGLFSKNHDNDTFHTDVALGVAILMFLFGSEKEDM